MDLADLIRQNKGDRVYETLARDCGGSPNAKRLQHIAKRTRPMRNFPDPESIRGLAKGLRVTEMTVILASSRSLGLNVDSAMPPLVQRLPAGVERLSEPGINTVLQMIQTLLDTTPAEEVAAVHGRARRDLADLGVQPPAPTISSDGSADNPRDVSSDR